MSSPGVVASGAGSERRALWRLTALFLLALDRVSLGGIAAMIAFLPVCVVLIVCGVLWSMARTTERPMRLERAKLALITFSLVVGSVLSVVLDNWLARGRAERVVAAVEQFQRELQRYPASLDELVPTYLPAVPRAKPLTLGQFGEFWYSPGSEPGKGADKPFLSYTDLPPFGRVDYDFRRRRFGRLD